MFRKKQLRGLAPLTLAAVIAAAPLNSWAESGISRDFAPAATGSDAARPGDLTGHAPADTGKGPTEKGPAEAEKEQAEKGPSEKKPIRAATPSDAVRVTGEIWNLNGASREARKEYDAEFRVYPSGVSTNLGEYWIRHVGCVIDDDEETFWETNTTNTEELHTYLDFTFDGGEKISRLVYGCRNDATGYRKGFAYRCGIYVSESGEEEDLKLVATGEYPNETSDFISYTFPERTAGLVRFEFIESKSSFPSAREVYFYREDDEEASVGSLFTDYARYRLAPQYDSEEELDALYERVKDSPLYETEYRALIERAGKILSGELVFNPELELSTADGAENRIERYGDIVDYARHKLRYNSFGTNRQATGIAAYGGETVTVYVEAEEDDPLPSIRFSQAYGHWTRWLDGERPLKRGVNIFTVPDLRNDNYKTSPVPAAGTVYLVNPYTEDEQSENVKVYFEGCVTYPVFHKGDDEETYKKDLAGYADRVREAPTKVIDLTELVCDHAIMTVTATRADEIYAAESPEENLEYWDLVLGEALAFEGVVFDEDEDYYDPRSAHVNVNYRVSQEWSGGWMFAHTEHIGLYSDAEEALIDSKNEDGDSRISWGYIHEMGHMTDLPERTIGETTNNMPANFNNAYFREEVRNPEYYELANAMSSDRDPVKDTFQQQRYNYVIFFLLESYFNGQWGRTDNLYRYEDKGQYKDMTLTEKQVFLTSLACGTDLGYYFTRWGYSLRADEPPFDEDTAGEAYKAAVREAKADRRITEKELPLWYLDPEEYKWMRDHGDPETRKGAKYSGSDTTRIVRVLKTGNGYSLTMPAVADEAHLGYEIWEGADEETAVRIGFTTSAGFSDTYSYKNGYEPTYRVKAYDRLLNHTGFSAPAKAERDSGVCEVNGRIYDSISEGIRAAGSGGTVLLLKDTADSGVTVPFPVTIMPKEKDITLTRGGDAPVFRLVSGANLTLRSNGGHTLTLTGADIRQSHALIEAEGNARYAISGVTFRDSITMEDGGALSALSAGVKGTAENCVFENNFSEKNGGAVYNNGNMTLSGCTFTGNAAEDSGGAFCNTKGGVAAVTGCEMTGNTAARGGAVFGDGSTSVKGGSMSENTAAYGGAVCFTPTANPHSRLLTIDEGTRLFRNRATRGSALYLGNGGRATFGQVSVAENRITAVPEPAFLEILNDPAAYGIEPIAEVSEKAGSYDIMVNNASLTIDGEKTSLDAKLYKNGTFLCRKMLPPAGDLTIALAEYTTAEPVVTTDFPVTADDLSRIRLADGQYELAAGPDQKSIYLKAGYFVTLNTNGGEIVSGAVNGYIPGTRTRLPASVAKEGHTFIGWYEEPDFSGRSVKYIEANESGDKTYYAKWIITTNMVIYETGGGKIDGEYTKLYTYEDAFALPENVTYRDHIFLGWHEKSDCTDEPVTEVKKGTDRKLVFYAEYRHLDTVTAKEDVEPSSCTEGGSYTEIVTCSVCKKKLSERKVETEPLGHEYSDWEYKKTPDCVQGGLRTRSCAVCGYSETENLGTGGHKWTNEYTVDAAPTCTADGSESVKCSVCGAKGRSRTISKLGHAAGALKYRNEVPATCTKGGSYTEVVACSVCGEVLSENFVTTPANGHDYDDWREPETASCSSKSAMIRRCRVCGIMETYGLDENGHDWEEEFRVDREPDCVTEGSRSVHCRRCGVVRKTEVLPAKGHSYQNGVCSVCGEPELAAELYTRPRVPEDRDEEPGARPAEPQEESQDDGTAGAGTVGSGAPGEAGNSGEEYSGAGDPGAGNQQGAENSGAGSSGTGNPGAENSGTGKSGTDAAEGGGPGAEGAKGPGAEGAEEPGAAGTGESTDGEKGTDFARPGRHTSNGVLLAGGFLILILIFIAVGTHLYKRKAAGGRRNSESGANRKGRSRKKGSGKGNGGTGNSRKGNSRTGGAEKGDSGEGANRKGRSRRKNSG